MPLSNAERQARFRARHKDQQPAAIVHTRRRVDRRSRPQRWRDAVTELLALQGACAAWLEALPDTLQGTATADALQVIADLDPRLARCDRPAQRSRSRLTTPNGSAGSHGCSMVLGPGDGLKGCAVRTGKRRLRPLTPPPRPSVWQ
jgi:hypothetical protein